ncbi:MAG: pyrroline-5-carboxylate reductase [Mariprofundaceae bacterium]|nr:pyrroline-5-carboxylate reductase [Mariprofundaceae bacterium]
MNTLKIAFIGAGNMAEAIFSGLIKAGHPASHICIVDPVEARCQALQEKYQLQVSTLAEACLSDLVVFAVKPQQMAVVLQQVIGLISADSTLISVAAGIQTVSFCDVLGDAINIVRVMPNTPCLLGEGMSALFSNAGQVHHDRAQYLMVSSGEVVWVDTERQLHAVTAVSGSGPAYFFLLAEIIQASAQQMGLSEELAQQLVNQTALGASRMLKESGCSAIELRQRVTSPGGTTQAAIDIMYEEGLPAAVRKGVLAANQRSKELG